MTNFLLKKAGLAFDEGKVRARAGDNTIFREERPPSGSYYLLVYVLRGDVCRSCSWVRRAKSEKALADGNLAGDLSRIIHTRFLKASYKIRVKQSEQDRFE